MDSNRFDQLAKELAHRTSRRAVVTGLGATALGGALGLVGRGRADARAAKVSICHYDDEGVPHYISVAEPALPAHLAHGDTVTDLTDVDNCGACGNRCDDGDACTTDTCAEGDCIHTPVTPVDCVVSDWSDWSACPSAECGGTRTRTRTVVTEASCGGAACPPLSEAEPCGTCPDTAACLDGACFTAYPYCSGSYGVAANGGGVNACICGSGSYAVCTTTGDCPTDQVCILIPEGSGYVGHCFAGCPA